MTFRISAFFRSGRSRWLALVLLVLAALVLQQTGEAPLMVVRHAQFDHFQRLMPRQRRGEPAVVVEVDSASVEKFGPWPWPRTLLAQLVDRLHAAGALVIGLDLLLAEPDQYSHAMLEQRLPGLKAGDRGNLSDPDAILAKSLAAAPTVLAVAGTIRPMPGNRWPSKPLSGFRKYETVEPYLPHYPGSLASLPQLAQAAHGEGLINAGVDRLSSQRERGVLRRVPAVGVVEFMPLLSLPLEMVRQRLGADTPVSAETDRHGLKRLHVGAYSLPVQPNGEILLHFGQPVANYYLSAADVLAGDLPHNLAGRFVFIGVTASGVQDRVLTPLGDRLPGVDVHVQVLESLLDNHALRRPGWMPHLELMVLIVWGALLILLIPALQPRYAILIFAGTAATVTGAGYIAFSVSAHLFDGASLLLLQSPVFIALLSSTLIAADRRRQQAECELQNSREAAARVAGELGAARRIQMGLLPDPSCLLAAGESRLELAALLEPARAIGGDYYDCFWLDERRFFVAIGDVSGKGVPASLFMAVSKTLTGALTRRNADLGQALREVGGELDRENPESLFVTTFVAILDAESGDLEMACAGHDAPLLLRDGSVSQIEIRSIAGPPLCALGDYPYLSTRTRLLPGDMLCLFTDGASEAGNGQDFYGQERLAAMLACGQGSLPGRLAAIRDDIRTFEAGEPPHDDLTLLLLKFNGR